MIPALVTCLKWAVVESKKDASISMDMLGRTGEEVHDLFKEFIIMGFKSNRNKDKVLGLA